MKDTFVWVDIPVRDLDRAMKFYGAVLGSPVSREGGPGFVFGLLPHGDNNISGCLVQSDTDNSPSKSGPLVYLNVEGRMDPAINAVTANGGSIVKPKEQIGPHGWRVIVMDSEGNRLALHAPPG